MKNIILFCCFFLLLFSAVSAQNLALSRTNGQISNGDTITVVCDTSTLSTTSVYANCQNTGSSTIAVKVRKKELSVVSGSQNTFCWDVCYPPNVYVSSGSLSILPDSTAKNFSADYKPKGHIGISYVMYTFYNNAGASDSVCMVVKYDASMSAVNELTSGKMEFSNAFPNPADNQISFAYSIPASSLEGYNIIIRDMVGNIVLKIALTENIGTKKVYTDKLNSGIYFYSLMAGDQSRFTKKLIIRH